MNDGRKALPTVESVGTGDLLTKYQINEEIRVHAPSEGIAKALFGPVKVVKIRGLDEPRKRRD